MKHILLQSTLIIHLSSGFVVLKVKFVEYLKNNSSLKKYNLDILLKSWSRTLKRIKYLVI